MILCLKLSYAEKLIIFFTLTETKYQFNLVNQVFFSIKKISNIRQTKTNPLEIHAIYFSQTYNFFFYRFPNENAAAIKNESQLMN